MIRCLISFLVAGFFFLFPPAGLASELNLARDLLRGLEQSKRVLEQIKKNLIEGRPIAGELGQFEGLTEETKATGLLLDERFKIREEEAGARGAIALKRHQEMAEGYRQSLRDYLGLVESLSTEQVTLSRVEQIETLLERFVSKRRRPILGSLPYHNLRYLGREPSSEPTLKPAYLGGNKAVAPEDLQDTPEAPISKEIAELAQGLRWNPVSIYEWVKNTIETEWYWRCMKGAEETLRQGSGNDCDQAALLVALLRASGYPSRYVRGMIEFFPGIDKAKNLTGIEDPQAIAELFQKAGIPYRPIIAGGRISNFQVEHLWVETQVPSDSDD